MMPNVAAATESDFPAICELLGAVDLPTEGLRAHLDTTLMVRIDDEVAGCVALEVYGSEALLRSVAVSPVHQRRGLGRALVRAALHLARRHRVSRVYLLTTTAEAFFTRWFGFQAITRGEVPGPVQESVEFRGACPASARAMRVEIEDSRTSASVIFACVHSAGRSQMAAGFFNALADPAQVRAIAAGTAPATRVHPEVVATMREVGIDLSAASPALLTSDIASGAALLVTMGCGESCPYVPGLERIDWGLSDPKGQPPEVVRAIRDDVRTRVGDLVHARGWTRPARRRRRARLQST